MNRMVYKYASKCYLVCYVYNMLNIYCLFARSFGIYRVLTSPITMAYSSMDAVH